MRKVVFSTLFLACIVISLSLYSMAMDWNEVNVVFIDNTSFTEYEQQIIIDYLTGEKNTNAINNTDNIICDLIGHSYKTEKTFVTLHNVYPDAPRCVQKEYETSICSRCSNTISTYLGEERINCH